MKISWYSPVSLFNYLKRSDLKDYCMIRGHLTFLKNTAPFYLTYYRIWPLRYCLYPGID